MIGFGIVFGVFVVFVLLIWFNVPKRQSYRIVNAGDVNDTDANLIAIRDLSRLDFVFENKQVNPLDYDIFVVSGNSMNTANIYDKDVVFVQKLCSEDVLAMEGSPVLVFEIDRSKDKEGESNKLEELSVELKLRKFISCVNVNNSFDFDGWFDNLKGKCAELSEKAAFIKEKFDKCVDKYKKCNQHTEDILFILSQTVEKGNNISYSFHPMKFLYGKVEYVVKAECI